MTPKLREALDELKAQRDQLNVAIAAIESVCFIVQPSAPAPPWEADIRFTSDIATRRAAGLQIPAARELPGDALVTRHSAPPATFEGKHDAAIVAVLKDAPPCGYTLTEIAVKAFPNLGVHEAKAQAANIAPTLRRLAADGVLHQDSRFYTLAARAEEAAS